MVEKTVLRTLGEEGISLSGYDYDFPALVLVSLTISFLLKRITSLLSFKGPQSMC